MTGSTPAALADDYGIPQFTVNMAADLDAAATPPTYAAPLLWGDNASHRTYRVRYVNRGPDADDTNQQFDNTNMDDDVVGPWVQITIPQVTPEYLRSGTAEPVADDTLPIIPRSAGSNAAPNLRFEYNDDSSRDARDHIDLLWNRNMNARDGQDEPNGYVIDRSANEGVT